MYRKLNPLPQPPVRPRAQYLGPDVGPLEETAKADEAELADKKEETTPPATERSQLKTGWIASWERPVKPLTRATGSSVEGNAFSDEPGPAS